MAQPKKGTMHQVMFVLVDKTDFATLESAITASDLNSKIGNGSAIAKFHGLDTGSSGATTSGTLSRAISQVRSHVFKAILKTTENNFDQMMLRIKHPSTAEQILVWDNLTNDDSDIMSQVILATSAASDANSGVAVANSRILVIQSRLSDFDSRLVSDVSDLRSQVSDLASDLRSFLLGISASLSDVESQLDLTDATLSDFKSDFQSRVPKEVPSKSLLSDVHSDLRSQIGGITASVGASDISDIASAVKVALASDLSDIFSGVTKLQSRVPKEVASKSLLSDVSSDLRSLVDAGVTLGTSSLSDIRSAITGALATDTYAEPGQTAPPATTTIANKIGYLYKAFRNKKTQTSTDWKLFADDTTTVDQKATVSDDGTTATKEEIASGP